jgi:hypothetical protein
MSIYNNIVVDHDRSIVVHGASPAGDVKNNIVMNSGLEHIYSLAPGTFYEEDYNIYNPDGNTSFVYANRNYNFADYNNTHAVTVNQHSLIADPSLDANYRPDSASDPVVNAGVNVGYRHLVSASWPTGPGGGSFTFATDETPDIGVFTFGLSGYEHQSETRPMSPVLRVE